MTSKTIEIPSFDFSAFYYPQILEALIQRKRIDVPELTDESDYEPSIQLLRAFALVGHLNNVLADLIANENTLPTAQLPETVRNMLKLIDYQLASASPSTTEVVYKLSKVFSSSFKIISENARVATVNGDTNPVIYFECIDGLTIDRTDQFTSVQASDGGTYSDFTSEANGGTDFVPWLTPDTGDALYFGHANVMWNALNIDVVSGMSNINGVWEYYDGDLYDIQPTDVTNIGGGNLEFDITSLLGTYDRRGATIRVSLNETGAYQDVTSTWNGSKNIAITGLIGQTTPSTTEEDYTIGCAWTEFAEQSSLNFADGTTDFSVSGEVSFSIPQNEIDNWITTTVNDVKAFWMRYRVISVSTPTSPTINRCRMDTGDQYVIASVVQGKTVADDPIGSSNGTANQSFTITRDNFIFGSETVTVDDEEWTYVDNFLSSNPQSKVYTVTLSENDRAIIQFGDGVEGKIPPVGQGNISIEYRYNAEEDGNVGANTITVDKTSLTYVNSIYNPRQASGWAEAEGATTESLERAKILGPASLRVKNVALNGDDAIVLAKAFISSDGSRPFSRATYIEEGYGAKTLELILVGSGGVIPTSDQMSELGEYFNGDKFANPPIEKKYLTNGEVVPVAFSPRSIDVTAIVTAPSTVTVQSITNALNQILQPEAMKDDGVTYEWNFGGKVAMSRLIHEIFNVDDDITDVDITDADVTLGIRELPVSGTFTITIQE